MLIRILLVASIIASAQASAKDLASIKGESFTGEKFKEELVALGHQAEMIRTSPDFRKKFLEHIIDSELLAEEALKTKIDQSKAFKIKMASARRDLLAAQYVQAFIDKGTTDQALKSYFKKNQTKFSDKEVRASHILFDEAEKAKATKILAKAQAGEDFAKLAKKYSKGPSGPKGGDLSFFKEGRMVPAFDKVAFNTNKGQIHSKLVKTRFGYHIIKVTDIRGSSKTKFKDKKQQIKRLRTKEIKEDLIAKLRKSSEVTIDEDALKSLSL